MTDALLATDEQLAGEVVGVLYTDPDTGFAVVEVASAGAGVRCVGPLAQLVVGQQVALTGRWTTHARHGQTFEVSYYEQVRPTTIEGLRTFLTSKQFAEVAPSTVARVLQTFGTDAGAVIETEPDRLVEEADLSQAEADAFHAGWISGQAFASLVRLLEPLGWSSEAIRRVHMRHGTNAPGVAREDPYSLVAIDRVGFAEVDRLGRQLGVAADDPRRLAAAAAAATAASRRRVGHQHLPQALAVEAAAALLDTGSDLATQGVSAAVESGLLEADEVAGETVVAPAGAFATERGLAAGIARLAGAAHPRLAAYASDLEPSDELTEGQRAAVRAAFAHPVSVLTGGPGTGKTRAVAEIVRAAEEHDVQVALCAPTGRAAKRLEELVGRPATTIHRLLEARPTGDGGFVFRYGRYESLPHDLVVVDEVSMCDTWLASRLVGAVEQGAHVLFVGDPDQLPSVAPGDVLRDLIDTPAITTTQLTEIHRQAAGSRVVALAQRLLTGDVGILRGVDGDLFMAEEPRRNAIVPRVVEAVANRIPSYFDVAVDDVQVLAPIYRGPAGVDALNDALKATLNPPGGRPNVGGFHVGDRVMQTRNDMELDVANGDVGRVVDLDRRDGTLRVAFPRGEATYPRDRIRDLVLAWAVTVHKAQGGEWPVVVLVCDRSHRAMLWRNLVYTGVTRARQALVVVGQTEALRMAAIHDRPSNRHTGLRWRLERELASPR